MSADSAVVTARHEPTTELGDGRERCALDGYLWPCPDERQRPAAISPDEEATLAAVGVGWVVWERLPDGSDNEPRGGMVCEVRDSEEGRSFVVVHGAQGAYRHGFTELHESRLAAPGVDDLPNDYFIRERARAMEVEAGRQTGVVDGFEVLLARRALTLLESIA